MNLEGDSFQNEVLKSEIPVLVDFWAPWCNPCKMLAPLVEEIACQYTGKLKLVKVNVDDAPNLAEKYGIMSIPTLGLFVDGEVQFKLVGLKSKREIAAKLGEYLK